MAAEPAPLLNPVRHLAATLAIVLAALLAILAPRPGSALAEETVTWQRFDVTIDLREDGSYHITDEEQILFEGGSFSSGFATIPLDRVDAVDGIAFGESDGSRVTPYRFVAWNDYDEEPRTFSYHETGSEIEINWAFPETENADRTFVLEYDVFGALRVYGSDPDVRQQIWWTAIPKDVTEIGPVQDSTVTINLPAPADLATTLLGVDAGEQASDHTSDGKTWSWRKTNLRPGDELIVRLEFPKLVEAPVPSWQNADDSSRLAQEKEEDRRSLYDFALLAFGLLILVAGAILLYLLWYTRGRDPHVGAVAEFLPAPPDDLPPGAAGALLDEVAHERDIVATVVDLGRRGVIKIDEQMQGELGGRDFALTLTRSEAELTKFERTLVRSLFPNDAKDGQETRLSAAKPGFARSSDLIEDQMYEELVKRGYFAKSPDETRQQWRRASKIALAVIVIGAVISGIIGTGSRFIFFPIAVSGVMALALLWLSERLPQKTVKGAEASAKWNAFKRYLGDIEKYDKLAESGQIFDKYLPYAVAFGLEQSWVHKFSAAGAAPPAWYGPVILSGPRDWSDGPRGHRTRTGGGGAWVMPGGDRSPSSGGGGDGFDMPTLQDLSDSAGGKLQSSSSSFFDMLTSAAEAFSDFSGSSGGGSRRHWGGGGGGFRGGGSRGGSSGGGKRGFH